MEAEQAYQALATALGYPESPEFKDLLHFLMTPSEAVLVASLPAKAEEAGKRVGLDGETAKQVLDKLVVTGVVKPGRSGVYRFVGNTVELHDSTQSRGGWDPKAEPRLGELWETFSRAGWLESLASAREKRPMPTSRVIPAYRAIPPEIKLEPWEDVREALKHASLIAALNCACRQQKAAINQACSSSKAEVCLQFDRSAEYGIGRGSSRKVSYEEALAIVDYAEDHGLIHTVFRNAKTVQASALCNCCFDCCLGFTEFKETGRSIGTRMAKSRYQATIDMEACNGCEICAPVCGWEAIAIQDDKALLDPEKCWGCGNCVLQCPAEAITMKLVRPPEWVPDAAPERVQG